MDADTPAEVTKGSWCEIAAVAAVAMPSRAPSRLCPLASRKSVPPTPIPGGRLLVSEQGTRATGLVCEHDSPADGQATRRAHEPAGASSGNQDATRVLMDSAEAVVLEGPWRAAG